jgi:hypothetical protein
MSSLFTTGISVLIFIQMINSNSVSLVNATAESELPKTSNINGYVPAVDRNSNNRDIIPVQLQSSENSQTDQDDSNIIIPIITTLGAIGGGIGGAFITQRLAERIQAKGIEAKEKEKQLEREQIRKTAKLEMTEYRDFLSDVLNEAKDIPQLKDRYGESDIKFLSDSDGRTLDTIFQSLSRSYLQYPFEKKVFAFTPEEGAKVSRVYEYMKMYWSTGSGITEDFGYLYRVRPEDLSIRLDYTKQILAVL